MLPLSKNYYVGGENGLRGAQTYLADDINTFILIKNNIITKIKRYDSIQQNSSKQTLQKYERKINETKWRIGVANPLFIS